MFAVKLLKPITGDLRYFLCPLPNKVNRDIMNLNVYTRSNYKMFLEENIIICIKNQPLELYEYFAVYQFKYNTYFLN